MRSNRSMLASVLFGIGICTGASGQAESPEDAGLIQRVRDWADSYNRHLQDFLCTQSMTRFKGLTGPYPGWPRLEQQELDVSYKDHKVGYRRLSVDGKTDRMEQRVKEGYLIPGGEFCAMAWPFEPKASADFALDRRETVGGQTICILRYRVPQERTNKVMSVNGALVPLGYQGFVDAVCGTGEIHRVRVASLAKLAICAAARGAQTAASLSMWGWNWTSDTNPHSSPASLICSRVTLY